MFFISYHALLILLRMPCVQFIRIFPHLYHHYHPPEAFTTLAQYREFCAAVGAAVPVLANITEFGQTPLFHCDELAAQVCAWSSVFDCPFSRFGFFSLSVFKSKSRLTAQLRNFVLVMSVLVI